MLASPFPCPRSSTAEFHTRAVERVIAAMHLRLDDSFSLEGMAEVAIMSPFHFNRIFRRLTGVPPCQFFSALRLETAKRLLLTTTLSVTDVCFQVGYNSLGTFTRRFTQLVGLSPQGLRALARGGFESLLVQLLSASTWFADPEGGECVVEGEIQAPDDFSGLLFVGLFDSPLPQGHPVACAWLEAPGRYRIPIAAGDRHFLMAAGLDLSSTDPRRFLLHDTVLRGSLKDRMVEAGERVGKIFLRPAEATDPPMLLTFPLLASEALAHEWGGTLAWNDGRSTAAGWLADGGVP
jgi:AraC family transcriptional regulator